MHWTLEKETDWVKARLAFGPIHTHWVSRVPSTSFSLGGPARSVKPVMAKRYGIIWGHIEANRKGQLVNKPSYPQQAKSGVGWACFSMFKAIEVAKQARAPAGWLRANALLHPLDDRYWIDSVNLQCRGVLDEPAIHGLFRRLRETRV